MELHYVAHPKRSFSIVFDAPSIKRAIPRISDDISISIKVFLEGKTKTVRFLRLEKYRIS